MASAEVSKRNRSRTSSSHHAETPSDDRVPSGRTTRADEVYYRLRTDILELNLHPGDQLDEDQLASSYGVSRTPVREALRRLGADGLVTLRPHRGAYVSEISLREIWEIEQVCELIEPFAARNASGRMSPATIAELRREMDALDIEIPDRDDYIRYMQFDVRFHNAILDAAGNAIMRDMVTHLYRRMNGVRLIANTHRFNPSITEHRQILDAIESGDGDAAHDAALHHIRQRAYRQRAGLVGPPSD
jgi:DNA-binding GntR family transcriptional regulator